MLLSINVERPQAGPTKLQFIEQRQPVRMRKSSGLCRPNAKRREGAAPDGYEAARTGAALAPLEF